MQQLLLKSIAQFSFEEIVIFPTIYLTNRLSPIDFDFYFFVIPRHVPGTDANWFT